MEFRMRLEKNLKEVFVQKRSHSASQFTQSKNVIEKKHYYGTKDIRHVACDGRSLYSRRYEENKKEVQERKV